jgi:hypothetical protein
MPITTTDTFAAHLTQLRETLTTLETHLHSDTDLSVFVVAKWQDVIDEIRDQLVTVQCETCAHPAILTRGEMYLCESCADQWAICERCQEPVKVADAIHEDTRVDALVRGALKFGSRYESRPYHAACASGPDGAR